MEEHIRITTKPIPVPGMMAGSETKVEFSPLLIELLRRIDPNKVAEAIVSEKIPKSLWRRMKYGPE